jgi:glyoxylase-like metal-dependent hydrolase (beta-lactamase superfamily II)
MEELLPGLFHWTAKHPNHGMEVSCHFVGDSGTAIDPLLPPEGIEWFEEHRPERIVLSTRHHLRDSAEIAERFGCSILAHESGLHEFEGGAEVEGFEFGDRLAGDVVALEMDSISPDDTVLRIEAGGGALLFADSVVNYGGLRFVPDHLIGDGAEDVKARIRERCRPLLDEDFEVLLFAHGEPLTTGAREALARFADG